MKQKQKTKQKINKKKNGYVLIDALVTVFISTAVFSSVVGGITLAADTIIKSRERILTTIEERNAFEKEPRIKTKQDTSNS